jgi:hypothetical protein
MTRGFLVVLCGLVLGTACSGEDGAQPAPAVDVPGSIIASCEKRNACVLYQVVYAVEDPSAGLILVSAVLPGTAHSFEDAERLARESLPDTATGSIFLPFDLLDQHPWRVVWYRSLTPKERKLFL